MFTLLEAQPVTATDGGFSFGNIIGNPIFMLVMMFVIIYFFMIKPQRKRQKEIENQRNNLQVGDKVVTVSGVYGTVKDLNLGETYISIEIAKGVVIKVDRNGINPDTTQPAPTLQENNK